MATAITTNVGNAGAAAAGGAADHHNTARTLDGAWSYHAGDLPAPPAAVPADWKTMRVPSNWHSEGLAHAGVVWFARTVEDVAPGRYMIACDGVDYAAEVFWDGQKVGEHRGYFAPFSVEVPPPTARGSHVLAIRVDSPDEPASAWSLRKTMIKGVLGHHDTRPGGAWSARGQEAGTGGIWGSVRLVPVQTGWLEALRVTTISVDSNQAVVEFGVTVSRLAVPSVRVGYTVRDPSGAVIARGRIGNVTSERPQRVTTRITIMKPARWSPLGEGRQDLYDMEVHIDRGDEATRDRTRTRFGLRTVARDERGRFLINGQPVFLRGTNYIGGLYLAKLDERALRQDLDLMRAAHINAIRVHAHVTHPRFYDLADEYGMMVWQDFPLQWGYDDSVAFRVDAVRQMEEMIDLLGNHPSIVFWCAQNEAPYSSWWMVGKYPDWDPEQNRLLGRALGETMRAKDPSRPSEENGGPAEHVWSGWYEGSYLDFARNTSQDVITEYGAQAVPERATLATIFDKDSLWPLTGKTLETWEYHNFQMHELKDLAKVPVGNSVDELIRNTQDYQARLIQFAAERLRLQKWQPVTAIFQFMFVEHWASINWGVVDYLRKPKQGYAALQRAYQPVLPVAARRGKQPVVTLLVVNDTRKSIAGAHLEVTAGKTKSRFDVDIPADDRVLIAQTLPLPGKTDAVTLTLRDAAGHTIAENRYGAGWFHQGVEVSQ